MEPDRFYSKGKNNPYKDRILRGWPWATVVNGQVVTLEGKLII